MNSGGKSTDLSDRSGLQEVWDLGNGGSSIVALAFEILGAWTQLHRWLSVGKPYDTGSFSVADVKSKYLLFEQAGKRVAKLQRYVI
jgi:hypothetical protein